MLGLTVIGALLIAAFAAVTLFVQSNRMKIARVQKDGPLSVACDAADRVILIGFSDRHGSSATYNIVANRLLRVHMFVLGLLSGLCLAGFTAKCLMRAGAPCDSVLWFFVWLSVIGVAWTAVYAMDRIYTLKLLRSGQFERLVSDGEDPIQIAATLHFLSRRFTLYSIVAAFLGGALITATDAEGIIVSAVMAMAVVLVWWYARDEKSQWVMPRELERGVVTVRENLLDGGWVTPAGVLVSSASFGLLYFGHTQAALVMAISVAAIALALWSERASRSESHHYSLEEWRTRLRDRFTAQDVEVALPSIL